MLNLPLQIRREVYNFEVDIKPPMSDNYVTATREGEGLGQGVGQEEEEPAEGGDHVCPALHTTHASGHHYPYTVRSYVKEIVNRANPQHRR